MPIQELLGQTIVKIDGAQERSREIVFTLDDGRLFKMWHLQECCESVRVVDVCGDIADLVGSTIVRAEEPSSKDEPKPPGDVDDSWTWTFYILGTARGTVTFRWLGESNANGYSERVDTEWVLTRFSYGC